MKLFAYIVFLLLVSLFASLVIFHETNNNSMRKIAWSTCLETERSGHIKPGSCQCASKLFDKFEESYDWMDACDILENKLRPYSK